MLVVDGWVQRNLFEMFIPKGIALSTESGTTKQTRQKHEPKATPNQGSTKVTTQRDPENCNTLQQNEDVKSILLGLSHTGPDTSVEHFQRYKVKGELAANVSISPFNSFSQAHWRAEQNEYSLPNRKSSQVENTLKAHHRHL